MEVRCMRCDGPTNTGYRCIRCDMQILANGGSTHDAKAQPAGMTLVVLPDGDIGVVFPDDWEPSDQLEAMREARDFLDKRIATP